MRFISLYVCILFFMQVNISAEKVTIVGANYVGLVTAKVLSQLEHEITCVDIDNVKIIALNKGICTIYEPGLKDIFETKRKITFTNNICEALDSHIIYICVGTPTNENLECDCTAIYKVFDEIIKYCNEPKIICIKSTIAPGTNRRLQSYLTNYDFNLVYNPEFMREGSALSDILTKNPIVVAGDSDVAVARVLNLYDKLINNGRAAIKTNFETAELIKYSWNAFSAIRITYVNELAYLCNSLSADVFTLINALSYSEILLPTKDIKPGSGIGGSCLPKDTAAFAKIINSNGLQSSIVHQAIVSNNQHIKNLINTICLALNNNLKNKIITILGLTFKANTNDIRYAPAIKIIGKLREEGAIIRAYDPQAVCEMKKIYPDITYFDCPYKASEKSDCIFALTDWEEIKNLDLNKIGFLCKEKILIDPRNIFEPKEALQAGFELFNLGRK